MAFAAEVESDILTNKSFIGVGSIVVTIENARIAASSWGFLRKKSLSVGETDSF